MNQLALCAVLLFISRHPATRIATIHYSMWFNEMFVILTVNFIIQQSLHCVACNATLVITTSLTYTSIKYLLRHQVIQTGCWLQHSQNTSRAKDCSSSATSCGKLFLLRNEKFLGRLTYTIHKHDGTSNYQQY